MKLLTRTSASPRPGIVLAVLSLAVFLITVDTTSVNVALPTLVVDLDATNSQLQWIVDAYNLFFAALVLAAGSIGDRRGRLGMLVAGLSVFGLASVASSLTLSDDGGTANDGQDPVTKSFTIAVGTTQAGGNGSDTLTAAGAVLAYLAGVNASAISDADVVVA